MRSQGLHVGRVGPESRTPRGRRRDAAGDRRRRLRPPAPADPRTDHVRRPHGRPRDTAPGSRARGRLRARRAGRHRWTPLGHRAVGGRHPPGCWRAGSTPRSVRSRNRSTGPVTRTRRGTSPTTWAGGLLDAEVTVSWVHGDYWPGNVLKSDVAHEPVVTGIVDWENALDPGMPDIDLVHWYLSTRTGDLGSAVCSLLDVPTPVERYLDAAGERLANTHVGVERIVLLAWLWQRLGREGRRADAVDRLALSVVFSMSATILVATAMAATGTWSVAGGMAALAVIAVLGFVPFGSSARHRKPRRIGLRPR
nr:phosphotransferase [Dietzia sp. E1]